jgi:hypothetical protein
MKSDMGMSRRGFIALSTLSTLGAGIDSSDVFGADRTGSEELAMYRSRVNRRGSDTFIG